MQISMRLLILCLFLWLLPITLHVSQQNVPEVSPQEQHRIIQEFNCITEVLHYEARSEGLVGLTAVLSVVSNRKQHKNYPDTYCDVIQQSRQFSYRNHLQKGQMMPRFANPKGSASLIKRPLNALEQKVATQVSVLAFEATQGTFKSILDPSVTMYHSVKMKYSLPAWATKDKFVVTIRNHRFYKG